MSDSNNRSEIDKDIKNDKDPEHDIVVESDSITDEGTVG